MHSQACRIADCRSLLSTLASRSVLGAALACAAASSPARAAIVVPDNGFGTAALPPGAYLGSASIVNGLPAGSSIAISALLRPSGGSEAAGGGLGGNVQHWNPAILDLTLTGSGTLAGFSRSIALSGMSGSTFGSARYPLVPEPSTAALLVLGVSGLAARRKRTH